jgi:RNA polymerase sigma-70 factor (ECF subfamily)
MPCDGLEEGPNLELQGHPARIEAFKRGDRATLTSLYDAHLETVERFLAGGFTFTSGGKTMRFRGFREPFRLQESVQASFIHAFRERARQAYDGTRPYRPFLLGIVRNFIIDEFRKEQTFAKYVVSVESFAAEGESTDEVMSRVGETHAAPSPEVEAMRSQLAGTLQAFVEGLDDVEKTLLERHLMGELSQREIADELGIDRNEVRKHVRTMRERLLKHLKSQGFIGSLDPEEVLNLTLIVLIASLL